MELFVQCVSGICAVEYISNKGGKKIMTNREWLQQEHNTRSEDD